MRSSGTFFRNSCIKLAKICNVKKKNFVEYSENKKKQLFNHIVAFIKDIKIFSTNINKKDELFKNKLFRDFDFFLIERFVAKFDLIIFYLKFNFKFFPILLFIKDFTFLRLLIF